MPVLIILLYYINDLSKLKRYHDQTEFVAHQMVNIIQNISQNRTDKRITKNDLKYALALAWKTVYPGTTMFYQNSSFLLGHTPFCLLYYVKGLENGNASCRYRYCVDAENSSCVDPINLYASLRRGQHSAASVNYKQDVAPSEIYKDLKINPGEEKIIIECYIIRNIGTYRGSNEKSVLNLRLVTPFMKSMQSWRYMFPSIVIFTPQPGLFDENGDP